MRKKNRKKAGGRRAVFLDRDGTINRNVPYCARPEEFELLPGAGEAICRLNKAGFITVVITNQSGIGRGYFSEETLAGIHAKMQKDLAGYGARIDAVYYCPHHPDENCDCRKPGVGLLLRAVADLGLNVEQSYFVGDSATDILAGKRLGCKTIAILTAGGNFTRDVNGIISDYRCGDLFQAAQLIISAGQKGRLGQSL